MPARSKAEPSRIVAGILSVAITEGHATADALLPRGVTQSAIESAWSQPAAGTLSRCSAPVIAYGYGVIAAGRPAAFRDAISAATEATSPFASVRIA